MSKRAFPILVLSLLIAVSTGSAQKKASTIIGEVVDVVSYITSGAKPTSPDMREILEASARGGNPLGILEAKTGKLYLVTMKQANTSANQTLMQYVGIRVAATGKVYRRGSCQLLVLEVIGKSIK